MLTAFALRQRVMPLELIALPIFCGKPLGRQKIEGRPQRESSRLARLHGPIPIQTNSPSYQVGCTPCSVAFRVYGPA
jgi:hypothetical protein